MDGALRIVSRPPLIVPVEELLPARRPRRSRSRRAPCSATTAAASRSSGATCSRATATGTWRAGSAAWGASGTRTWVVLLTGRDDDDPLFLQVKQAGPSVIERYAGRRAARHHGQRVVQGQRLMQVDGDIFLGWLRAAGPTRRRATTTSASCGTGSWAPMWS